MSCGEIHRGQLSGGQFSRRNHLGIIIQETKVWGVVVLWGISWGGQLSRGQLPSGDIDYTLMMPLS